MTSQQLDQYINRALIHCRVKGYPTRGSEYEQTVRDAVIDTLQRGCEANLHKLPPYAYTNKCALNACRDRFKKAVREPTSYPIDESEATAQAATPPQRISEVDFDLLRFVVKHGQGEAARQLEMRPEELRERLDAIRAKVENGTSQ